MAWDNTPSQKDAVKTFLVTVDGKIDLEASTEKYRTVCRQYMAKQMAEDDLVGQCIGALFDQYKGAYLNMDYIKSQTVQRMIKQHPELNEPSLFNTLAARVENYLHENSNQEAVPATAKRPAKDAITGKPFSMKKSRGFCRVADQATEPSK